MQKLILQNNFLPIFLLQLNFVYSFRCNSSVCKHAIQDGPKIKLQTLVKYLHQILMDFTDTISVMPSEQCSKFL